MNWAKNCPSPFLNFYLPPREATLTAIDEMADSLSSVDTRVVTVSTDFIEAPSVDLADKLLLAQLDGRRSFIKRFSRIPQPDPSHGESEFRLWKCSFLKFLRAVPRPSNRVLKTDASLADRPWDFEGNWHHAGEVAREMKLGQVPSVLAAMVYPPPIRNDSKACQWLQRGSDCRRTIGNPHRSERTDPSVEFQSLSTDRWAIRLGGRRSTDCFCSAIQQRSQCRYSLGFDSADSESVEPDTNGRLLELP